MNTTPKDNNKLPNSYIKELAIQMQDSFVFDNVPHLSENDNCNQTKQSENDNCKQTKQSQKPFVGREEERNKFVEMLGSGKGVYLITGYRGMGKTSFVNIVLNKYNETKCKKDRLNQIRITVAQKKPTETEVLKLMVGALKEKCKEILTIEKHYEKRSIINIKLKITGVIFIVLFLVFLLQKSDLVDKLFTTSVLAIPLSVSYLILTLKWVMAISLVLFSWFLASLIRFEFEGIPKCYLIIDELHRRCYAHTSAENGQPGEFVLEAFSTKITHAGSRKVENYPIASSQEIEQGLQNFLKEWGEFREMEKFVFVFDELDKVEQFSGINLEERTQPPAFSEYNPERAYFEQLRERKQVVQEIIAGLKNFLTTTNAPFIFIAGREMFEASMADIADRQSSISSIFTYVFYIESLLKESIKGESSLSSTIEIYLYKLIYGEYPKSSEDLYKPNGTNIPEETVKINLFLQQFVVYLAYRSNGSPKKLIRLVHEFVQVAVETIKEDNNSNKDNKNIIIWKNEKSKNGKFCLHFTYAQQQRIGFISYIYRPFLVKYGASFKKYSDSLIVSTSFLFDHLLKFHPFAFSYTHLELIPEVMSANKTPALRDHIRKIIEYLSQNHIKETEIGIFDFKFYSKTVNEIVYLTKTFEEESAAFNFTLDESYLVKLHVGAKIRSLRKAYENYTDDNNSSGKLIYSIAHLNGVLGDLHYFDQEYHDAIIAYSDVFNPIKGADFNTMAMDMREFILLLKYKLKLGLVYEKIKSFEEALALYSDAVKDAKQFVMNRLKTINESAPGDYEIKDGGIEVVKKENVLLYLSSSLSDILQIANQAFLAKMVLQEKMGVEGITAKKSAITMGGFLQIADMIGSKCGDNTTIISNYFLQLGHLLYFKNSVKAFEWGSDNKNSLIPTPYFDAINLIIGKTNTLIVNKGPYRMPVMALNMYCLGLKYLVNGRIIDSKTGKPTDNIPLNYENPIEGNIITEILTKLAPSELKEHNTSLSKIHYKYMAIFLSGIGDCLLGMLQSPTKDDKPLNFKVSEIIHTEKLKELSDSVMAADIQSHLLLNSTINDEEHRAWIKEKDATISIDNKPTEWKHMVEELIKSNLNETDRYQSLLDLQPTTYKEVSVHNIICCYYLSALYFKKCSRIRSYSFQLRKILYLVRLIITDNKEEPKFNLTFVYVLDKLIVKKILEASSQTAEYADVHDFNKFKNLLTEDVKDEVELRQMEIDIRNNVSNFPDAREAIVLLSHIKLRLLSSEKIRQLNYPHYSISTQYLRLIELSYEAKYYEIKLIGIKSIDNCVGYLHSLLTVIQIMEIYDNDYLVGNSFLAYYHYRLAAFFTFENGSNHLGISEEDCEIAKQKIEEGALQNKISFASFDQHYNYEMAAVYYDKAIKLHSAGDDYKKAMNEILYLEDDLSDASYHFGAAMDRYLLINGTLLEYYKKCKKLSNKTWNEPYDFIR